MSELARRHALRFVIGIGAVSLFADFTYEGGRSIAGPFLAILGAGPFLVGLVSGAGEFLGYLVRVFSGRYADRRGHHWLLMGAGYTVNLLAVPTLALAGGVGSAVALLFAERFGKGLRNPPRDALLSRAGRELGHGFAFGLHEALDQLGAFLGPLAVAAAVAYGGYRLGFGILLVPALCALIALTASRGLEPKPAPRPERETPPRFSATYFRYIAFAVVTVAGFTHFQLAAYHWEAAHRLPAAGIPLIFALAMGMDALAAVAVGRYYDRIGLRVLYALPLLTLPAAPLLFLALSPGWIALGAALWGAALGLQESVMRAAVASLTPEEVRASAYGYFDAAFGAAWMVGSAVMGALYGASPAYLVGFAILAQFVALPLLARVLRPH